MEIVVSQKSGTRPRRPSRGEISADAGARLRETHGIEELSHQLSNWCHLWPGGRTAESGDSALLVRERISGWLVRCFGSGAGKLITRRGGDLSLAASTPLFTAFLGRRAVRELSRHVLRDL